jgi:hypothetical protein
MYYPMLTKRVCFSAFTFIIAELCFLMAVILGQARSGDPTLFSILGFPTCGVLLFVGGIVATNKESLQSIGNMKEIIRKSARLGSFIAPVGGIFLLLSMLGYPVTTTAKAVIILMGGFSLTVSLSTLAVFMGCILSCLRAQTNWARILALGCLIFVVGAISSGASVWLSLYVSPYAIADGMPSAMYTILGCILGIFTCAAWFGGRLIRVVLEVWRESKRVSRSDSSLGGNGSRTVVS